MKDFLDKVIDILYSIGQTLDGISEKIFEQTKIKVDLKIIIGAAVGIIFLIIFVKAILGFIWSQL